MLYELAESGQRNAERWRVSGCREEVRDVKNGIRSNRNQSRERLGAGGTRGGLYEGSHLLSEGFLYSRTSLGVTVAIAGGGSLGGGFYSKSKIIEQKREPEVVQFKRGLQVLGYTVGFLTTYSRSLGIRSRFLHAQKNLVGLSYYDDRGVCS